MPHAPPSAPALHPVAWHLRVSSLQGTGLSPRFAVIAWHTQAEQVHFRAICRWERGLPALLEAGTLRHGGLRATVALLVGACICRPPSTAWLTLVSLEGQGPLDSVTLPALWLVQPWVGSRCAPSLSWLAPHGCSEPSSRRSGLTLLLRDTLAVMWCLCLEIHRGHPMKHFPN